jgi:molybdopterin-guanine dinucleotide biosynthesis protein A
MKFSGAVLAGGKSSRFGSDKARFVYRGKPMMQWVLDSFEHADERFIVANQAYDEFDLPVYEDVISSPTPLSGIHSALVHARHDWVAIAACDMPFLTKTYWSLLYEHCQHTAAVVVESDTGLEPLAAFYHKTLIPDIEASLRKNQKAVHIFLDSVATMIVGVSNLELPANTFYNFNRLEDIV